MTSACGVVQHQPKINLIMVPMSPRLLAASRSRAQWFWKQAGCLCLRKCCAGGGSACLLIVSLLLDPRLGFAEWVKVDSPFQVPELQTIYIDQETIQREGNLVTLWQLTDYRWMQGGPRSTPRFLSTTSQKQFDCSGKRLRFLAFTEYSQRMAKGRADAEYVDQDRWLPVRPEGIDESLWEIACGTK